MTKVKLHLNAVVEKIPDGDGNTPAFVEWCEENNFDVLNGGRRAWCHDLGTYIRGNEYLITLVDNHECSSIKFLATKEELDQLMSGFDRPEIEMPEWTEEEIKAYVQQQVDSYRENND